MNAGGKQYADSASATVFCDRMTKLVPQRWCADRLPRYKHFTPTRTFVTPCSQPYCRSKWYESVIRRLPKNKGVSARENEKNVTHISGRTGCHAPGSGVYSARYSCRG